MARRVQVENLKIYFPIKSGLVLDRHVGDIKAVDDVTFDDEARRDARPRGRVRLRQVDGRARDPAALRADRRARSSSTARTSRISRRAELREQLRRRMQMIFQDPYASLNPRHSVGRMLGEPIARPRAREPGEAGGCACARAAHDGRPARRTPHRATRTSSRAGSGSASASRGRSSVNPDFIVADEPVSALDVSIQAQIINLLEQLQDEFDLTYLFIAHDLAVVRHISDRIAVMYLGSIVEVSSADELYDNPLHPYTISLLSAVPIPDPVVEEQRKPIILAGDLPSPANPPRHAGSTRAARTSSRRGAATRLRRCANSTTGTHRRVSLGRADQGRAASSRTRSRRCSIRGRRKRFRSRRRCRSVSSGALANLPT